MWQMHLSKWDTVNKCNCFIFLFFYRPWIANIRQPRLLIIKECPMLAIIQEASPLNDDIWSCKMSEKEKITTELQIIGNKPFPEQDIFHRYKEKFFRL